MQEMHEVHHTLLHRDADQTQRVPEIGKSKGETHVSALHVSVSEQVLLMTCKVKVSAPNRCSTIVKALIDPVSSSLFIHERLAQHLHLLRGSKNARVEGIGETNTLTRGSVWFQVSGVENDGEKIGVEAFVLKKITKHLPLHPIPLALKWEHLSKLKLADLDFKTPACTDLLLGVEVFTSILCDGQQTSP